MISMKKWPWVLLGSVLSLALWTFVSVNTGIFNNEDTFASFTYFSSYFLIIGFWALVVLKTEISEGMYKFLSVFLFALTPFFCMQITMLLSGAVEYTFNIYFINLVFYISVMGIFLAIIRRFWISAIVTMAAAYIFNMASFVVNIFRGTPLIPSDFLAIGTAAQVAEHYSFDMRYPIVASTVIAALVIGLLIKFSYTPKFRYRNIIMPACGVLTAAVFFVSLATVDFTDSDMDVFDQFHANNTHGTIYSFYINVRKMLLHKPEGYDEQATEALIRNNDEGGIPENIDRPNIIVIMNESLADLQYVGKFSTNIEYMPFMKSLTQNTIKGELLVSPFGGYTCNSEFEFLTGLSMGLLPSGSAPYLQYISKPMPFALPDYLSSNGYKSVALHPYYARCWNRQNVYEFLGFDEFISLESFDDLVPENEWEYVRYYLSDRTSYKGIERRLEQKDEDERLFLFNVTMQNHGGYTYDGAEFPTVTITDMQGHYREAEQYLSLVRESDKAFEELVNYLKNYNEHTIVVMFGDHQPAVEQEFFEELYGKPLSRLSMEELQQRYKVPYVIWANYNIESRENVMTSTNYLSDIVLDVAGLPKNGINSFTSSIRGEIPQINAMGHYDAGGYWHENEPAKNKLLGDYSKIEYFALTSKKNK